MARASQSQLQLNTALTIINFNDTQSELKEVRRRQLWTIVFELLLTTIINWVPPLVIPIRVGDPPPLMDIWG